MSVRLRFRFGLGAAIVVIGGLLARVAENWVLSRLDDAMSERNSDVTKVIVTVATWASRNQMLWLVYVLAVGALVILALVLLQRFLTRVEVSVEGVRFTLFQHEADGMRYIIADDVMITNHRVDQVANISADYQFIETADYTNDDGTTGHYQTDPGHKPEPRAVLTWEQSKFYKRNQLLTFPLRLEPGASATGYIAFSVGGDSGSDTAEMGTMTVKSNWQTGSLVFVDNITRKTIKRFPKKPSSFMLDRHFD